MTFREVGRMTLTMFNRMYKHYKDDFDLELLLHKSGMTYEQAFTKAQQDEEWL